jgi:hypothetical protein
MPGALSKHDRGAKDVQLEHTYLDEVPVDFELAVPQIVLLPHIHGLAEVNVAHLEHRKMGFQGLSLGGSSCHAW